MSYDFETFHEYEWKPFKEDLVGEGKHQEDNGRVGLLEKKMEKVDRLADRVLGWPGWLAAFGGFVAFWLLVLTSLKSLGWWPK